MPQASAQRPLSMRKLLIPGLLLVLLVVLVWPHKPADPNLATETKATVHKPNPSTAATAGGLLVSATSRPTPADPPWNLGHAIALNPFDPPLQSPVTVPTPQTELPPRLDTMGGDVPAEVEPELHTAPTAVKLQAIFYDQSGAAAIIEDRIMHAGDKLPDGRAIVHISSAGVELTP